MWARAAGAPVSDPRDLRHWAEDLEHLNVRPTSVPGAGYGLGFFDITGRIGHNGSLAGCEGLTIRLPQECATPAVALNTDITSRNSEPAV
ncbi:hypothetical protein [Kitasatospora sp. NPDC015120]|uniref:hypothetical protein n=1 Tax=Kitasatospora sp. NPDC015120 TaxID=3364023 RepID=UPI0036F49416